MYPGLKKNCESLLDLYGSIYSISLISLWYSINDGTASNVKTIVSFHPLEGTKLRVANIFYVPPARKLVFTLQLRVA